MSAARRRRVAAKPAQASQPMMAGETQMPTCDIPGDCLCTWSVSKPGPGRQCVSTLRVRHALCPAAREHEQPGKGGRG